jgi:hypothetical protein
LTVTAKLVTFLKRTQLFGGRELWLEAGLSALADLETLTLCFSFRKSFDRAKNCGDLVTETPPVRRCSDANEVGYSGEERRRILENREL